MKAGREKGRERGRIEGGKMGMKYERDRETPRQILFSSTYLNLNSRVLRGYNAIMTDKESDRQTK